MPRPLRLILASGSIAVLSVCVGCIGLSIGGRTIQQTCPDLEARMAQLESRMNELEQSNRAPTVIVPPAVPTYELPVPVQTAPQSLPGQ